MIQVLSIGNSFSVDATRYLHQIARKDGHVVNVASLYIGSCTLERHYRNMLSGARCYELQFNGSMTGFFVSMEEALLSRAWDYICFQQMSAASVRYESFQPYLTELSAYAAKCCPQAKQVLHQTWAYGEGDRMMCEDLGYSDSKAMFRDVESSYRKAAKSIGAKTVIPSGELFQTLLSNGLQKVHRDGHHATLGAGRYALGLLWYAVLTGNSIKNDAFRSFDEGVSSEEVDVVKRCVDLVLGRK